MLEADGTLFKAGKEDLDPMNGNVHARVSFGKVGRRTSLGNKVRVGDDGGRMLFGVRVSKLDVLARVVRVGIVALRGNRGRLPNNNCRVFFVSTAVLSDCDRNRGVNAFLTAVRTRAARLGRGEEADGGGERQETACDITSHAHLLARHSPIQDRIA